MTASLAKLRAVAQQHYRKGIASEEIALHIEWLIRETRTYRKVAADSYARPLLLELERDLREARNAALANAGVKGAKLRVVEREIARRQKAGSR